MHRHEISRREAYSYTDAATVNRSLQQVLESDLSYATLT